ncbi:hypothetical protein [Sphingomonas sp. SRS2]|uniref:hypothetical protein n=1 Tax=Sphingomonas sp. SRS2 TaxID=133190 RepID=UPI00061845D2|nr:hypothetical protein [Sphingomonas sp. SRS2]KKC24449.1 hypothetical protein WP12_19350 [Sphingomonas sp. SRS2]
MKIIQPIAIEPGAPLLEYGSLSLDFRAQAYVTADPRGDPTVVLETNVPETDAALWSAGTYATGVQKIFGHRIYEVIAAPSTTAQPDIGAAAEPATWLDLGPANRWKAFDGRISSETANPGTIVYRIAPGTVVNAIAFFGLYGSDMMVTMTDPIAGQVYSVSMDLQDNSGIVDYYNYFFDEIVLRPDVLLVDLPAYGQAEIEITIAAGVEDARVGEIVLGKLKQIGEANFGTSVGIQSYSKKDRDEFGSFVIVPRAFNDRADYDVTIETSKVYAAKKLLTAIRDTPTVFIGDENRLETVVYGFFKDFSIVLSNSANSACSIQVEGLT